MFRIKLNYSSSKATPLFNFREICQRKKSSVKWYVTSSLLSRLCEDVSCSTLAMKTPAPQVSLVHSHRRRVIFPLSSTCETEKGGSVNECQINKDNLLTL